MGERRSSPNSLASATSSSRTTRFKSFLRLQRLFERLFLALQFVLLAADFHFFELGEVAQAGFENRLGLGLGELEALDELGLGFVLAPDDADDLIEIQERDQQAVEDVQPSLDMLQAVLQPPAYGLGAKTRATR